MIPAGQISTVITGKLLVDNKFDAVNKTLILTLGSPSNAALGANAQDTIAIQETDPPPSVTFATAAETLSAGAGTFSVNVNLSKVSNATTTIPFTLGGTAVAGADYGNVTASPLVIPAGQTSGTITGTLNKNQSAVAPSTLTFTLGSPTNGNLGSTATNTLTINPAPDLTLVVAAPTSVTAGTPFIVTVTAQNAAHNTVTGYTGTVHFSSTDPQAVLPADITLTSGFGFFLATLKTAGTKSIMAADTATVSASIAPSINVKPAPATSLSFSNLPTSAITGTPFNVTITALDPFYNVATGYGGHIRFASSDPAALLPQSAALASGMGSFSVIFKTEGNQTITAADVTATNPAIIGTSTAIPTSGLSVSALTKTPTGFTATFNQAINPADLTLYGKGSTVQDVLLVGQKTNIGQPYPGTLIVNPLKEQITFNVSSNFLVASNPGGSAALPDDTYTVTLLSGLGSNGFQDVSGQGFDDGHGGHTDYVGTFTTTYQHDNAEVLGIPDFARGPTHLATRPRLSKSPTIPPTAGTSASRSRSTTLAISRPPVSR